MKLWIARDDSGLCLYKEKPTEVYINGVGAYFEFGEEICQLKDDMFPEVTFENSPQEVELKLV